MLFDSIDYLLFFICIFIIYWFLPKNPQNIFLLVASYVFYSFWDYRFITLLFTDSFICYISARLIQESKKDNKKTFFYLSIFFSLSILLVFKYFNFFIDSLDQLLLTLKLSPLNITSKIILPVGISFFTFRTMSYIVDVYQNKIIAQKNFLNFLLYVSFFPQLIAGPIERSESMFKQIESKRIFSSEQFQNGLALASLGFLKKMVFADNLSISVNKIFSGFSTHSILEIIAGSILFSIQLYFDFSGYCDIAVGSAKMLGFNLSYNFKAPYFAKTASQFWERWHITLSSWFRDYIYFPLALISMRKSDSLFHKYFPHFLTMLLMGIWHGAGFNYIIFGLFWAIVIVLSYHYQASLLKIPSWINSALVIIAATFGWFLFRLNGISSLKEIAFNRNLHLDWYFSGLPFILFIGLILMYLENNFWFKKDKWLIRIIANPFASFSFSFFVIITCLLFAYKGHSEFIYFKF